VIAVNSFIHSRYFYSTSSSPLLLRGTPDYSIDTVSVGLAQGPYVAAGVRFKPATFWMQGTKLTTEPPCPTTNMANFWSTFKLGAHLSVDEIRYKIRSNNGTPGMRSCWNDGHIRRLKKLPLMGLPLMSQLSCGDGFPAASQRNLIVWPTVVFLDLGRCTNLGASSQKQHRHMFI